MWPTALLVCVTHIGCYITGYDWLYSWLFGGYVATVVEVYSCRTPIHKTQVSVLFWVWHLFPILLCQWTKDFRLTNGGRLLPSLYLHRSLSVWCTWHIPIGRSRPQYDKWTQVISNFYKLLILIYFTSFCPSNGVWVFMYS